MPKRRAAKGSPLKYLVWVVVLAVGGYIGYSVWYTKQVDPEKGIVVCIPPGEQKTFTYITESGEQVTSTVGGGQDACFWSAHIHAVMDLTRCGKQMDLPKDKGVISGPHTHKEPNRMHSAHSPQRVDAQTKSFLDPTPLTIRGFLGAMDIDIKTPCPGSTSSSATITVNGTSQSLDYIWQNGDNIQVNYE